jgi:hypothetical protein
MIAYIFHYICFFQVAMRINFLNRILFAQSIFTSDNLGHLVVQLCCPSYAISPFAMQVIAATDVWVQSAGLSVQEV